uniref:Uncharacterized protein n=1 Tax=Picea glauca TaxID=3330 RepID=A0A117NJ36_PICGL|nr:hypothetical protein ABT39_MTgene776 [Picea glauca]QHR90495.1 hypothetical protein Q903MT_gene4519 [Picea sitchensis]
MNTLTKRTHRIKTSCPVLTPYCVPHSIENTESRPAGHHSDWHLPFLSRILLFSAFFPRTEPSPYLPRTAQTLESFCLLYSPLD